MTLRLIATRTAGFMLALSAGFAVVYGARFLLQASAPQPSLMAAAPVVPSLDVDLLTGGASLAIGSERIVLPDGARFRLRVASNVSGRLEVHAINPQGLGQGAALWSGTVRAGDRTQTASMRLEGVRGLETLWLTLRAASGQVLAERDIQIWHL